MNPARSYRLIFNPTAWREIMRLPEETQNKIFDAAYQLESNPRPSGCKKMEGEEGLYRIRVGNFRIIYDIRDEQLVVTIVKVGDRKAVYRR